MVILVFAFYARDAGRKSLTSNPDLDKTLHCLKDFKVWGN